LIPLAASKLDKVLGETYLTPKQQKYFVLPKIKAEAENG
jgi:hypothetical protein